MLFVACSVAFERCERRFVASSSQRAALRDAFVAYGGGIPGRAGGWRGHAPRRRSSISAAAAIGTLFGNIFMRNDVALRGTLSADYGSISSRYRHCMVLKRTRLCFRADAAVLHRDGKQNSRANGTAAFPPAARARGALLSALWRLAVVSSSLNANIAPFHSDGITFALPGAAPCGA